MNGTYDTAATASNYILAYGDWRQVSSSSTASEQFSK